MKRDRFIITSFFFDLVSITLENIINYNDVLVHHIFSQFGSYFTHIYKNWEDRQQPKGFWDPAKGLFPIGSIILYNYRNLSNLDKNNFNIKFFNIINGHIKGTIKSIFFTNAYQAILLNFYMSSLIDEDILQKINTLENIISYPNDIWDLNIILKNLFGSNFYSTYKAKSIAWEYLKFYDKQLYEPIYPQDKYYGVIPLSKTIINIINWYHLKNVLIQLYLINKYPNKHHYLSGL